MAMAMAEVRSLVKATILAEWVGRMREVLE